MPLSENQYAPGHGQDLWILSLHLLAVSSLAGAINFIATIHNMRAPGMTWTRMPLFVWGIEVYAFLLVVILPVVGAGLLMLLLDRQVGTHFFLPDEGGNAVLYQHIFWFFGHPEVYVLIIPALGIISEVIPVFARKPIFGYKAVAFSSVGIAFISMLVWAHHMFTVGLGWQLQSFFMIATMLVAIPTGVKILNWLATLLEGEHHLRHADAVRARLHRDLHDRRPDRDLPGGVPARLAGARHLLRGRALPLHDVRRIGVRDLRRPALLVAEDLRPDADEKLGKWTFWLMFVGFNLTFMPQHFVGLLGMPRRVYTYTHGGLWEATTSLSTIGAGVMAVGMLLFFINAFSRGTASGPGTTPGSATRSSGSRPRRPRRRTSRSRCLTCPRRGRCATCASG